MSALDYSVTTTDGTSQPLSDYAGKVILFVNVASKCGFTKQYAGLEALYRAEKDNGLQILGFPCNQFGGQEPGTDADIADFCSANYDVSFPVFSKIDVNGSDADPLYVYLRAQAPGELAPGNPLYAHIAKSRPEVLGTDEVKWNFTKFLVGRDGEVLRRYESSVTPEEIKDDLAAVLV